MRFLANENIPLRSVFFLREAGYDIASITEDAPGRQDEAVLKQAVIEQRMLLTFDRDYGELIFKRKLPAPIGVIYFRFEPLTPTETGEYLFDLLMLADLKWEGQFTTVERGQVRQRPL